MFICFVSGTPAECLSRLASHPLEDLQFIDCGLGSQVSVRTVVLRYGGSVCPDFLHTFCSNFNMSTVDLVDRLGFKIRMVVFGCKKGVSLQTCYTCTEDFQNIECELGNVRVVRQVFTVRMVVFKV